MKNKNKSSNKFSRSQFLKLTVLAGAGVLVGTKKLFAFGNGANTDFYHFTIGIGIR